MRISDWSSDVCSSDLVDEQRARGVDAESLDRQAVDGGIGLHQLFGARHDDIAEPVEDRLRRAEAFPEFLAEIGDREQRHARGLEQTESASCEARWCPYG